MERWAGRTAVVTGASSGIGRAVAQRLARAGMKVSAWARREQRLHELAQSVSGPGSVQPVAVDLRDEAAVKAAFARVRDELGGTDVLINNAGLGHQAPLLSGETQAWREMLELNVLSLCVCTREAVAQMRERGDDGHVIHISSMAAHRVPPGSGVYSASKYAVRSLTEGLRQELREAQSKIRVSAISPGFVETEFHQTYFGDAERAKRTYSRFKVLEADDIAETVAYLLAAPDHMAVHDVLIRPRDQLS